MADRFVLVPTRKWGDPWYRRLSATERDAWDYLTQPYPETFTGIFEELLADMAHHAMLTVEQMEAALARFIAEGKVRRAGDVTMAVKFFEVQSRGVALKPEGNDNKKPDNRLKPICSELASFQEKAPELVAEWKLRYAPWMLTGSPSEGASKGLPAESAAPSKQEALEEPKALEDQEALEQAEAVVRAADATPAAAPASLLDDATPAERASLAEMRSWRGFSFDYAKSLAYLRQLALDYPTLDLLDVCKGVTAWLDDKPGEKGGHLRLRNFCKTAFKYGKSPKPPEPKPEPTPPPKQTAEEIAAQDAAARAEMVADMRQRAEQIPGGYELPADLDELEGLRLSAVSTALLNAEIDAGLVKGRPGSGPIAPLTAALARRMTADSGPTRTAEEQREELRKRGLLDDDTAEPPSGPSAPRIEATEANVEAEE